MAAKREGYDLKEGRGTARWSSIQRASLIPSRVAAATAARRTALDKADRDATKVIRRARAKGA